MHVTGFPDQVRTQLTDVSVVAQMRCFVVSRRSQDCFQLVLTGTRQVRCVLLLLAASSNLRCSRRARNTGARVRARRALHYRTRTQIVRLLLFVRSFDRSTIRIVRSFVRQELGLRFALLDPLRIANGGVYFAGRLDGLR
jgi:hypothetical protein